MFDKFGCLTQIYEISELIMCFTRKLY